MMPAEFGDLREEPDGADSVKYWSSGRADSDEPVTPETNDESVVE